MVRRVGDRYGATFKKARRGIRAEVAEVVVGSAAAVLALPLTYMNESGQAVAPLMRYYNVAPGDLLVAHDDIDVPFGRLKVQFDRGSGGNNGVRSIIRALGTQEFWRLKIGVGRPPGSMDPADYVLRRFAKREQDTVALLMEHAADLVEVFVTDGGDVARQRAGEIEIE